MVGLGLFARLVWLLVFGDFMGVIWFGGLCFGGRIHFMRLWFLVVSVFVLLLLGISDLVLF